MLMWGLGDVVLTFLSQEGISTTSPSAADLFYIMFFPLAYLGLVRMVRRQAIRMVVNGIAIVGRASGPGSIKLPGGGSGPVGDTGPSAPPPPPPPTPPPALP